MYIKKNMKVCIKILCAYLRIKISFVQNDIHESWENLGESTSAYP